MHRTLLVSLALFLLGHAFAHAQSCRGLASFSSSPIQVTGEASLDAVSRAVRTGIGYGLPRGPFGAVSIGSRTQETFTGSSLDLAATAGYEISLGDSARVHLCPLAALGREAGPNDGFNSGVDRLRQSARVGLAVGTSLSTIGRWEILPTIAVSYAYQKDQAHDDSGAVLFQIADRYALAQLGLGFIFRSSLSLRPFLDLPLGLEGSDPTVGLTIGYNFGR